MQPRWTKQWISTATTFVAVHGRGVRVIPHRNVLRGACSLSLFLAAVPPITDSRSGIAGSRESATGAVFRAPGALAPAGGEAANSGDLPRRASAMQLVRNGWTYDCMECHGLFAGTWHHGRALNEHRDVQLRHGANRFCLNCHHPLNRNAWVDYDGSEIQGAAVVSLCAKCHGTTYRDWEAGVHGRQSGAWLRGSGETTKLRCNDCHDPHQPAFAARAPLPPLRYPARAAHPPPRAMMRSGPER